MAFRKATMRTISAFVRSSGPKSLALAEEFSEQSAASFEATGYRDFGELELASLMELATVLSDLETKLPGAITHWNAEWQPLFYQQLEQFRKLLEERIEELRTMS